MNSSKISYISKLIILHSHFCICIKASIFVNLHFRPPAAWRVYIICSDTFSTRWSIMPTDPCSICPTSSIIYLKECPWRQYLFQIWSVKDFWNLQIILRQYTICSHSNTWPISTLCAQRTWKVVSALAEYRPMLVQHSADAEPMPGSRCLLAEMSPAQSGFMAFVVWRNFSNI